MPLPAAASPARVSTPRVDALPETSLAPAQLEQVASLLHAIVDAFASDVIPADTVALLRTAITHLTSLDAAFLDVLQRHAGSAERLAPILTAFAAEPPPSAPAPAPAPAESTAAAAPAPATSLAEALELLAAASFAVAEHLEPAASSPRMALRWLFDLATSSPPEAAPASPAPPRPEPQQLAPVLRALAAPRDPILTWLLAPLREELTRLVVTPAPPRVQPAAPAESPPALAQPAAPQPASASPPPAAPQAAAATPPPPAPPSPSQPAAAPPPPPAEPQAAPAPAAATPRPRVDQPPAAPSSPAPASQPAPSPEPKISAATPALQAPPQLAVAPQPQPLAAAIARVHLLLEHSPIEDVPSMPPTLLGHVQAFLEPAGIPMNDSATLDTLRWLFVAAYVYNPPRTRPRPAPEPKRSPRKPCRRCGNALLDLDCPSCGTRNHPS